MPVVFELDFDKVMAAVTFLASQRLPELSKGKICKLLFLADRAHVVRFGRPITGDRLCALEHGPILSTTLRILNSVETGNLTDPRAENLARYVIVDKRYTHPHYRAESPVEMDALSRSDAEILAEIVSQYGQKTFKELRAITHDFAAYNNAWNRRTGDAADMRFEDLFEDEDADDIVEGAKEEMMENAQLQEAVSEYAR